MFRLSTCLLLGSAEALGSDETSLMQGMKPVQDLKQRRHDKSAVTSLLESAKGMLKNGETDEVTAFAQRALDEIRSGVLPAIEDASLQDQALLNAHWGLFQNALDALEEGLGELRALQEAHDTANQVHTQCRTGESQACSEKVGCDYELFDLWRDYQREESLLRTHARAFDAHFCPGNGTLPSFRELTPPKMNDWKDQKVVVDAALELYDPKRLECEGLFSALDSQSATCNADKSTLEEVACDHASKAIRVRSQFTCDWQHAIDTYDRTEKEVRLLQLDRVREWRHLSTVECLLTQTTSRNGRPCDDEGEFDGLYAQCEDVWKGDDQTAEILGWVLHFPCEERQCSGGSVGIGPHLNDDGSTNAGCGGPLTCPSVSPDCEYRTYVASHPAGPYSQCEIGTCRPLYPADHPLPTRECVGNGACQPTLDYKTTCVPVDVHAPCSTQFDAQEYGQIFDFIPQPEFYWRSNEPVASGGDKNTHCNQPEACQVCDLPVVQQCDLPVPPPTTPPPTTPPPTTAPPGPQCGDLPELSNAEWVPAAGGQYAYRCLQGYSFNGVTSTQALEIACLSNGWWSPVHACLPINDCLGHTCGAFGTCVDAHMDYTCQCAPGFEEHEVNGEKVCGNEDDCHGSTCGSGGLCVDEIQDYSCDCHEGWHEVQTGNGGKTCNRNECGQIPRVNNSASNCQAGTNYPWCLGKAAYGDTIEYDCIPGFTTDGGHDGPLSFSIVCQADGTFTPTRQCLPVSCGAPDAVGSAEPDSREPLHFEQEVQYSCPEGHGPDTWVRRCQANGQLSAALACEPKLCAGVPVFPMAQVTSQDPLYFFGQTAEFSCEEGYSTDPADPSAVAFSVGCLAQGWETGIAGCRPVTCEFQPDETHLGSDSVTLSFGSSISIQCAADHSVTGLAGGSTTHVATCGADGEHDIPSCSMIVCPASNLMPAPSATVQEFKDHTVGSRATYTCDAGYAVAGSLATSFEVECRSTGVFSALSTCRNIDDCVGHTCGSNGRCVDGINEFSCTCESGFEETTNEAGERICGNIDDCGPSACGAHGVCHDHTNGYECDCDEGFLVQDAAASDRICEARICSLAGLENVDGAPDSMSYPESLFIDCAHGFAAGEQAFFEVECGADGVLKAGSSHGGATEIPVCRPVSCGQAPLVEFAQLMEHGVDKDFIVDEVAIFGCQGGEVELRYQCRADGSFEIVSEMTTCQNECGEPSIPLHAHREGGAGSVFHPGAAMWKCDTGFTHGSDHDEVVAQGCAATGVFEPIPFDMPKDAAGNDQCDAVRCDRPVAPQNWEWTTEDASDFDFLNPAFLRCADGYEFNGASLAASQQEVRCEANGAHSALPPACELITFRVFGTIRNAVDTSAIPGATIELDGGGSHVSNHDGEYELVLTPGTHEGVARADGFIENHVTIIISDDFSWDLYLSPELGPHDWRFVLTWNARPEDLDSHLVFHDDEYWCPEMYFGNWAQECSGVSATLDVDDVNGNGPETTTLLNLDRCNSWVRDCKRWVFKVKHYTATYDCEVWRDHWTCDQWGSSHPLDQNTHGWALSGATVKVYNYLSEVGEYHVDDAAGPLGGSGAGGVTSDDGLGGGDDKFWSVVAITSEGTVDVCTNENCDP